MIHVFTSTGNSLQIAQEIASRTGQEITFINSGGSADTDDTVFVVCPVYSYNIPRTVREYLPKMQLKPEQKAVLVVNFGSSPGNVLMAAFKDFEAAGIELRYGFGFQMPENYIMMFEPPSEEEIRELTSLVPEHVEYMLAHINGESHFEIQDSRFASLFTHFGRKWEKRMSSTKAFRVSGECTSCGLCESICPRHVISIKDGRPVWTSDSCEHCCGCIHRCPAGAISYKKSFKRSRYVNPNVHLPDSF